MEKNIPEFLIDIIRKEYSESETNNILDGLKKERKTTFRVNKIKSSTVEIKKVLNDNSILFSQLDSYDDAIIIEDKDCDENIRRLDIYKEGKIYLQSLSSMLPALFLEVKEKENILDMCAAPRRKN